MSTNLKAATERAVRTFVQAGGATAIVAYLQSHSLGTMGWAAFAVGLGSSVLSVIMSAIATQFGDGTTSFLNTAASTQEDDVTAGLPDATAALTDASGDAAGDETPNQDGADTVPDDTASTATPTATTVTVTPAAGGVSADLATQAKALLIEALEQIAAKAATPAPDTEPDTATSTVATIN